MKSIIVQTSLIYWMIGGGQEYQNACKEQLQELGHQMSHFISADAALNALLNQAKIPDVFLIDYHLPRQSGLVLSWILRDINSVSKILFMTTDPSIEDEHDPITPIILQKTLDFGRVIQRSQELVNQTQRCLSFLYEKDEHFIEKVISIIESVIPKRKCLLLVSYHQKTLELLRKAQMDLKHVEVSNATKYLSGVNYGVKLIALYINFLENATEEGYAGICIIVDFKPLLPFLDCLDLYINGTTIKASLNYLNDGHYLVCAYPLQELSDDCKKKIMKTHDYILNY